MVLGVAVSVAVGVGSGVGVPNEITGCQEQPHDGRPDAPRINRLYIASLLPHGGCGRRAHRLCVAPSSALAWASYACFFSVVRAALLAHLYENATTHQIRKISAQRFGMDVRAQLLQILVGDAWVLLVDQEIQCVLPGAG